MKFKRGAFIGEKRVRPMMIKNDLDATISIAYDVADVLPIAFLQMSWLGFQVIEMGLLPDFEPNEYLFQTHKDKGEERWEIFAWAVRDAMSKVSGRPTTDLPVRLKMKYFNYLVGKSDEDMI